MHAANAAMSAEEVKTTYVWSDEESQGIDNTGFVDEASGAVGHTHIYAHQDGGFEQVTGQVGGMD